MLNVPAKKQSIPTVKWCLLDIWLVCVIYCGVKKFGFIPQARKVKATQACCAHWCSSYKQKRHFSVVVVYISR